MKSKNTYCGQTIDVAIKALIAEAAETDQIIEYEFNGVTLNVAGVSDPALILREWNRGMLREGFVVDPHPPSELSEADIAEDERLAQERDRRAAESGAAYEAKMNEKRSSLAAAIDGIVLEVSKPDDWHSFVENNSDPYGAACVRFADQWGRLMQVRLAEGKRLEDIAQETSHDAETEGITGFMYGCAVATLAHCWVHGEGLRRWHNLDTQIGTEGEKANESGGVLNPALLSIGG